MDSSESELSSESLDLIYNHVSQSDFKKVRRKHAMAGLYLSGFLDAKVPSKNRPFGPWKTWKTQWCMIRRSGTHLEIQIGSTRGQITHQIQIPQDTVICRTESRSKPHAFGIFQYLDSKKSSRRASVYLAGHSETETQKWIGIMRDILRPPIHQVAEDGFSVSLIDNEFSRTNGFSGLYGNLSTKNHHLVIRDPHTNQIKVSWHWNHLQKIQIFQSECTEDFQRSVLIKTNW
uniref:PH domain-containing protein n=1 Tax=Cacopsylla melanoneura TaxID=428564 RepID=A0A8D8MA91_9HEMI